MRKVEIEFMRRHIGALGHEAHVAQRAGIHDRLEILGRDGIQLAALRFVDEVEQAREAVAEIEAAPASVTDIEDAPQLSVQFRFVVKGVVLLCDHMAYGRAQTTFRHIVFPDRRPPAP